MAQEGQDRSPRMKYKSFVYGTQVRWVGARSGVLRSEGKPEFRVASPPEFKGEEGVWTPEDLFVGAINACTMMTFAAYAQHAELPLVSYTGNVVGILEFVEGSYRFTKIVLRPRIVVENEAALEPARKMLQQAHEHCLITNSVRGPVLLEPKVELLEMGT